MDSANKCRRRHQSNVTGSSLVVVVALLFGTLINASPAFVGVHRPTMSETTPSSSTPTPTTTSSTAESSSAGIWRRMPSSTFLTLEAAEAERILANRDRKLSSKLESGADYTDSREMLAGETSQPFSSPTHRKPNTDTTAALASLATLNAQSALTSLTSPTAAQVESDAAAIEVAANEDSPGVSTNCESQCRVPVSLRKKCRLRFNRTAALVCIASIILPIRTIECGTRTAISRQPHSHTHTHEIASITRARRTEAHVCLVVGRL